jgi:hypothetical protein
MIGSEGDHCQSDRKRASYSDKYSLYIDNISAEQSQVYLLLKPPCHSINCVLLLHILHRFSQFFAFVTKIAAPDHLNISQQVLTNLTIFLLDFTLSQGYKRYCPVQEPIVSGRGG